MFCKVQYIVIYKNNIDKRKCLGDSKMYCSIIIYRDKYFKEMYMYRYIKFFLINIWMYEGSNQFIIIMNVFIIIL